MTHTYSILTVSQAVYDEIKAKFLEAGYEHAFHDDPLGMLIDMRGVAIQAESEEK